MIAKSPLLGTSRGNASSSAVRPSGVSASSKNPTTVAFDSRGAVLAASRKKVKYGFLGLDIAVAQALPIHPVVVDAPMPDDLSRFRREVSSHTATLLVAAPVGAQLRLCESLERIAVECVEVFAGVLAVHFSVDRLQSIGNALSDVLVDGDRSDTRCRIMPRGTSPQPVDLMQSQPLEDFLGWVEGQWLTELISQGRLVTYFQPIVRCAGGETPFAYECLIRGTELAGGIILPDRMFGVARAAGQLVELDRAARLTAIATVAQLDLNENVFINVNPRSILDPEDCVEGTLRAVLELHLDPRQFVFEVVESDRLTESEPLRHVLECYREAGFRVALDDLGAGYSSLHLLAEIKPDFVKVDRKLIHGLEHDEYKAQVAAKLLELARELGVLSVVEGVETEAQWKWSRDHGANFAQGFYFAPPLPKPAGRQEVSCVMTLDT